VHLLEKIDEVEQQPEDDTDEELQLAGCSPIAKGNAGLCCEAAAQLPVRQLQNESTQPLDENSVGLGFRSVLEQLEIDERQQHPLALDLPSSLALPFHPLLTPRDLVPVPPPCTPFVFSTAHLKSPSQVCAALYLKTE
jgi:hypothetical protein